MCTASARAWAKLPRVAAACSRKACPAATIAAVISRQLGALTRARRGAGRAAPAQAAGHGGPPCAYAVAVLGSAGRGESLLAMDQDNALVFAEGAPDGPEDRWFAQLGSHIADILHEVGVPYCKGGVMAKNPQWRGSVATWRERIGALDRPLEAARICCRSISSSTCAACMATPRLADRAVAGGFRRRARRQPPSPSCWPKRRARSSRGSACSGGFRTEQGRIDLKKAGLFGIVSAARALAIRHHVVERSTPARLAGVKALGLGGESDLDALIDAQALFLDLMLGPADRRHGARRPPSNAVVVKSPAERDKDRLRAALRSIEHLDALVRDLLFNRR